MRTLSATARDGRALANATPRRSPRTARRPHRPPDADADRDGGHARRHGRQGASRWCSRSRSSACARSTSAASTCSRRRRSTACRTPASSSSWGAAFTQQFQGLDHSNTADAACMTSSVNTNQLMTHRPRLQQRRRQPVPQRAARPGIRVAMTSYLSARHHQETWVKDGYLLIDESPIKVAAARDAHEVRDDPRRPLRDQLRRRALPPHRQRQRDVQPVRRQPTSWTPSRPRSAAKCTSARARGWRWAA